MLPPAQTILPKKIARIGNFLISPEFKSVLQIKTKPEFHLLQNFSLQRSELILLNQQNQIIILPLEKIVLIDNHKSINRIKKFHRFTKYKEQKET